MDIYSPRFPNRVEAGKELAPRLLRYQAQVPIVLGLPRGGVPVAAPIAKQLHVPLDIWVVRKVGAPMQPELGLGAVAEGGELYVDRDLVRRLGVSPDELAALVARKQAEVEERAQRFRHGSPPPDVRGRTVIVVDDGIATGGTARATVRALRKRGARRIVLAVPVAATQTLESLRPEVDDVVCLHSDPELEAIGFWYDDFTQTTDGQVAQYLDGGPAPAVAAAH